MSNLEKTHKEALAAKEEELKEKIHKAVVCTISVLTNILITQINRNKKNTISGFKKT